MEIMGLVVIVILITLGMFFVVKFMITKQPSDVKQSYTRTEVAANILNTMLKTTAIDCYGMTVTQLLQDCAVNHNIENSQALCDNQKRSCAYTKEIIESIFEGTLVEWGNQNFDLKVKTQEENILHCTNEDCLLSSDTDYDALKNACLGEKEAKQSYIPTNIGVMTINLEVC